MTDWHIKPTDSCGQLTIKLCSSPVYWSHCNLVALLLLLLALAKVIMTLQNQSKWTYFDPYFLWHPTYILFSLSFDTLSLTVLWLLSLYFQLQELPKYLYMGVPWAFPTQHGLTMSGKFSVFFPYETLLEFRTLVTSTVHMSLGGIWEWLPVGSPTGPGTSLEKNLSRAKVDI